MVHAGVHVAGLLALATEWLLPLRARVRLPGAVPEHRDMGIPG